VALALASPLKEGISPVSLALRKGVASEAEDMMAVVFLVLTILGREDTGENEWRRPNAVAEWDRTTKEYAATASRDGILNMRRGNNEQQRPWEDVVYRKTVIRMELLASEALLQGFILELFKLSMVEKKSEAEHGHLTAYSIQIEEE
jgi:hypothetical protein